MAGSQLPEGEAVKRQRAGVKACGWRDGQARRAGANMVLCLGRIIWNR